MFLADMDFVFSKASWPPLIFVAIVVTFLATVLVLRSSRRNKDRSVVLQSMGFIEVGREEIFVSPNEILPSLYGSEAAELLSPVAKGSSSIGETVIFDVSGSSDPAGAHYVYTVVGFRVSPSIPDFEIRHTLWVERFSKNISVSKTGPGYLKAQITIGAEDSHHKSVGPTLSRVDIESNPEFARNFIVKSFDTEQMKRIVTPSLMDALVGLNDSKLEIVKVKDWLFIYRTGGRTGGTPPQQYPEMLHQAVDWASRLNLRAASGTA